jgi:hypothetical protein
MGLFGVDLRQLPRRCGDADQVRRLLALAVILDGSSLCFRKLYTRLRHHGQKEDAIADFKPASPA